jgi:hypothetical protein
MPTAQSAAATDHDTQGTTGVRRDLDNLDHPVAARDLDRLDHPGNGSITWVLDP